MEGVVGAAGEVGEGVTWASVGDVLGGVVGIRDWFV